MSTSGIEDVARAAGVSVATVSRALRGLPNVAPSTRERVRTAAEELQYVASPHASRLAARTSTTVGLVLPILSTWFHGLVFATVEAVMAEAGYDVVPFVVAAPEQRAQFFREMPFRKRVDGIALCDVPLRDDEYERLRELDMRMVTMGFRVDGTHAITVDNRGGARQAARHLTALGHRDIGLIYGSDEDPFGFPVPSERHDGFVAGLAEVGGRLRPEWTVPGGFALEGGADAMQTILRADTRPTAIFAMSDEMAIGAIHAARRMGIDVPGELSIIGFDDHPVAHYVGLSTVSQRVEDQGVAVAHALLALLDGREPEDVLFPGELIIRETTRSAA